MNKSLVGIFLGAVTFFAMSSANAELFINPVGKSGQGASEISGHFGSISIDYEAGGGSFDIDRTFVGASYIHGLSSTVDVFGTFSFTLESELESLPSDGDGIILGGGVRMTVPNDMGVSLNGYGQFLIIDEDYGSGLDGEEMAMMVGVVASKAIDTRIKLYGGAEINIYSDMDINSVDVDRDDFLGFRVGLNYDLGGMILNANMALMHEKGFFFSLSKNM